LGKFAKIWIVFAAFSTVSVVVHGVKSRSWKILSLGFGTVVLEEGEGARTLRFLPDGGGVVSLFTAVR
jgi:hypothetical protein